MQKPSLSSKFKLFLPTKWFSLTLLFAALSYWSIVRLRHNRVYIPRTLSFHSFTRYHQLAYFPEVKLSSTFLSSGILSSFQIYSKTISKLVLAKFLNRFNKIILRQFQNLSEPNSSIASTKFLNRKLCSAEPTYLLSISHQMILLVNCSIAT